MDEEKIDQELDTPPQEKPAQPAETLTTRQLLVRALCGGYLVYLAYNLVSSFFQEGVVLTWSGIQIVSAIGALVFAVVGVLLLIHVCKNLWAQYGPKN